jgi:hypothetical protein
VSKRLRTDDRRDWVIEKLGTAEEMTEGAAPEGAVLFENFSDKKGRSDGYHPSRGAAVRTTLATTDLAALETAVARTTEATSASGKNRAFFASLLNDAPELAARMRLPEEIDAQQAEHAMENAAAVVDYLDRMTELVSKGIKPEQAEKVGKNAARALQMAIDAAHDANRAASAAHDTSYRKDRPTRILLNVRAVEAAVQADAAAKRAQASLNAARSTYGSLARILSGA